MATAVSSENGSTTLDATGERPYVVFGYGSLIFKPPPHVIAETPGFLKGYVRRFAQKSHDHRGTPENPGRVVTLIHKEDWDHFSGADPFPDDDVVWGVAYTIDPKYESEVRDYLDYREKDGYTLEEIDIFGIVDGHERVVIPKAYCYVGRPDNPSFIGSEPIEQLAEHIWRSVGPSGPTRSHLIIQQSSSGTKHHPVVQEYLYRLAEAVRRLAPESHDSHLFELETRCRELDLKADRTTVGSEVHDLPPAGA